MDNIVDDESLKGEEEETSKDWFEDEDDKDNVELTMDMLDK